MLSHVMDNAFYFWLALGFVLGVVEMLTPAFGFILVGGAAFLAAGLSKTSLGFEWQVVCFAVASLLLIFVLRPRLVRKMISNSPGVPDRNQMLVGKTGHVTETIDAIKGTGRVLVDGEDWSADSSVRVEKGTTIKVVSFSGIKLKVEPI